MVETQRCVYGGILAVHTLTTGDAEGQVVACARERKRYWTPALTLHLDTVVFPLGLSTKLDNTR